MISDLTGNVFSDRQDQRCCSLAGQTGKPTSSRVIFVTGADSRQIEWVEMMLGSLRAMESFKEVPVACMNLGLSLEQQERLSQLGVKLFMPRHQFKTPPGSWPRYMDAYLAQPFMREILPGWEIYCWIDADIWFQDERALHAAISGALKHGLAITPERSPCYRFQPGRIAWIGRRFIRGFGLLAGSWLWTRAHLNTGFYAIRVDAPHWEPWMTTYQASMNRAGEPSPYGQFALNRVVHGLPNEAGLRAALLEPWSNWICDRGPPMWDDVNEKFCEPNAGHAPISALHLAEPAKDTRYRIFRTGGGYFDARVLRGTHPDEMPR